MKPIYTNLYALLCDNLGYQSNINDFKQLSDKNIYFVCVCSTI